MATTLRCPHTNIAIEATGVFRTRYLARIPSAHTVHDVTSPEYFGAVIATAGFKEMDLIEVEWEDGTKWGTLSVRAVEPSIGLVTTKAREPIKDEAETEQLPDGWDMEFIDVRYGWAITSKGERVEAGFATPEKAANRIAALATKDAQRAAVAGRTRKPVAADA